jgi:tRNA pseudouridine38-40 synthase
MKYIKLLLEYDGTDYRGWQSQKSGVTIQDILSERIFSITGEQVKVTGASRTDAGVHALGQVAVFETRTKLSADTIMRALNAKLPLDIRVLKSEATESKFNPRYRAVRKSYFYIISKNTNQSAFLYRYVWDIKTALDLDVMKESASMILGEHDYASFRGSGCGSKTTVRRIYSIDIKRHKEISFMTAMIKGNFITIHIEANAFLRHMVRNIVGTLVEIGRGSISPGTIKRILKSRDRKTAGPTAPAKGLFLEKIIY